VEEVVDSGIEGVIIITGRGKSAIEDHFDISYELEQLLAAKKKTAMLKLAHDISNLADISYIRQKEALGLGHAVHRAKDLVGEEPFAVILSDDIIASKTPCTKQLVDVYNQYGASVIALMEVPNDQISAYGAVDATAVAGTDNLFSIHNMVEKPKAEDAPSNLAIIGRYVLTPDIFKCIESIEPGSGGEIQLTDAMKYMLKSRPIYGLRFEGTRYDAGDKFGFLKATVEFALNREDLGPQFRQYLKTLSL
jgi:UTP--glucose-1-phosphate uridylyltransferase